MLVQCSERAGRQSALHVLASAAMEKRLKWLPGHRNGATALLNKMRCTELVWIDDDKASSCEGKPSTSFIRVVSTLLLAFVTSCQPFSCPQTPPCVGVTLCDWK